MSATTVPAREWGAELLLLAALWGASFLFMRLAVADFGAIPTAALRVAVASVFLLALLAIRGQLPLKKTKGRPELSCPSQGAGRVPPGPGGASLLPNCGPVMLVGLFNSALPFALYAWALQHITTGLSSILNATVPLLGAVVARVWLDERLTSSRIAGLALGFIGIIALAVDKAGFRQGSLDTLDNQLAIGACLLATLSYALSAAFTRRYLIKVPPIAVAAGSQIGATLALVLPALWTWPAAEPTPASWLAVIALGVLCTGVAYVLYFRLISRAGATRALAVTFVVPVFALLYGSVFLGERVSLWMLACGCIILLGTALATGLVGRAARQRADRNTPLRG